MDKKIKLSVIYLVGGKYDEAIFDKSKVSSSFADETLEVKNSSGITDFAEIRTSAAKKAKYPWLLYLDTDEIVTPELKSKIIDLINTGDADAYAFSRRNIVFKKELKHCGLWPDYVLRLIKKSSLIKWEGKLHEQPQITGKIENINVPLIHYKHDNLTDMVDKTNKWSEIEAELMFKAHHPPMNAIRFMSAGAREFYKRFVREKAFMDGTEGAIYGLYQVYSRLISYSKLWEMQLKEGIVK